MKPGSIEDVSAVGNREIGKRGLGNWYSTDGEIKMGKQYADEIEKSTKFITDPVVVEYVNRIGQNIVKNSDCKVPFTIKVIDSDEINAMALPGGFFYVNSGLILAADEEAELAGVMAHETAHVCAHHAAREMTRLNYAQIGMMPLMIMLPYDWTGYGIYEAAQLAIPITFLQFSRDFEAQADYLGVQYMYRAGYDPQAFITFFEKIQALEKRKPGLVAKAFSDHPQTPDRILHSQEEIARILPAKQDYLVTTSEFDDVKARLARIENKRRLTDTKGVTRPSLRRASTDGSGRGRAQVRAPRPATAPPIRVTDRQHCIAATTATRTEKRGPGIRFQGSEDDRLSQCVAVCERRAEPSCFAILNPTDAKSVLPRRPAWIVISAGGIPACHEEDHDCRGGFCLHSAAGGDCEPDSAAAAARLRLLALRPARGGLF